MRLLQRLMSLRLDLMLLPWLSREPFDRRSHLWCPHEVRQAGDERSSVANDGPST